MDDNDPFRLSRVVDAQDGVYAQALAEMRSGRKRTHWMWFIFPQLKGLGASAMAQHFGISSLAEARAYLDHPVLGPRLVECVESLNALPSQSASEIFGYPDDLKLRSSVTLFASASATGTLDLPADSQQRSKDAPCLGGRPVTHAAWKVTLSNSPGDS